jgi:hypothetical protein
MVDFRSFADYHPNDPPSPDDGPAWVDETELEEVGHATQPRNVLDFPSDRNISNGTDLVREAYTLTGYEPVEEIIRQAGSTGE